MSSRDYPEHLNPFDENYTGAVEPSGSQSRQKYNTWSHRIHTSTRRSSSFLQKPWAALNISPNGKVVEKLSFLKTAVQRFASKKKRLFHSTSFTEPSLASRSHSVHEEYNFRIISPKLKEKIRQQAFSQTLQRTTQPQPDSNQDEPIAPQLNGRLPPLKLDLEEDSPKPADVEPISPESEKELQLGARPKIRKKKPPPPPPPIDTKTDSVTQVNKSSEKPEDSHSTNSSITQDLEKDAVSEEENSNIEVCQTKEDQG